MDKIKKFIKQEILLIICAVLVVWATVMVHIDVHYGG